MSDDFFDKLERGARASLLPGPEGGDKPGGKQKFYGVVVGKVVNPIDPLMLGRVQVQTPFVDSLDLSPWARIASGMAGPFHGTYHVPNLYDEVLVAFEQGDVNVPYILGSLANMVSRPPLPSPLPQIRTIRTLAGNQITFAEAPPAVVIQNGPTPPSVAPAPPSPAGVPYQTVALTNAGVDIMSAARVTITVGTNTVTVTPGGIVMNAGPSTLALTAAGVVIDAPIISLQSSGQVGVFAPMVRINS